MVEYVAVGCPVGRLNREEMQYFFAGGQLLGLNTFAYRIWLCFQGGNKIENVVRNPELLETMDAEKLRATMEEMAETGVIVPIDEAEQYVPLRQGVGVGYNEAGRSYLVFTDRVHMLDYEAYLVWSYCDGRRKFSDIFSQLRERDLPVADDDKKRIIYTLLHESVLFLSLED